MAFRSLAEGAPDCGATGAVAGSAAGAVGVLVAAEDGAPVVLAGEFCPAVPEPRNGPLPPPPESSGKASITGPMEGALCQAGPPSAMDGSPGDADGTTSPAADGLVPREAGVARSLAASRLVSRLNAPPSSAPSLGVIASCRAHTAWAAAISSQLAVGSRSYRPLATETGAYSAVKACAELAKTWLATMAPPTAAAIGTNSCGASRSSRAKSAGLLGGLGERRAPLQRHSTRHVRRCSKIAGRRNHR